MRKEILLAGFGGQGIISIGILIACAAGKYGGKHVAQAQSYGPEARGGACKAEVVIDDGEIDYIKTLDPNVFIVMSQLALDQYIGRIDPEKGIVIADSSLVTDIPSNYRNVYQDHRILVRRGVQAGNRGQHGSKVPRPQLQSV